MTASDIRVTVNRKEVAAKVIDGEAVMINLTTGTYYSMDNVGAAAWALLETGHSVCQAAARIAAHWGADESRVLADMRALLEQLQAENLVRPSSDPAAPSESVALEPVNGRAYEAPVLSKYSDMGDVLALDPPLPELKEEPWSPETAGPARG